MHAHGYESSQSKHDEVARSPQSGDVGTASAPRPQLGNTRTVETDPEPGAALLRIRILIVFFAASLFELTSAQPLSLGVIGGSSLTQDFQNRSFGNPALETIYSTPLRWIAGGMVEVRLPKHLAVEVDGLYHDLAFTIAGLGRPFEPLHVVTWEVPVLAKYRVSFFKVFPPWVKPFIEAGPSFRTSYNLNGALPSSHGFAAGVGMEARAWKLRIAPQVRYVRWARDGSHVILFTVPDQAQFLVGISF
jgi:hypothetical protein